LNTLKASIMSDILLFVGAASFILKVLTCSTNFFVVKAVNFFFLTRLGSFMCLSAIRKKQQYCGHFMRIVTCRGLLETYKTDFGLDGRIY
jgi:hypothetical protein